MSVVAIPMKKSKGEVLFFFSFFFFFSKPSGIRPHKDILTGQSSEMRRGSPLDQGKQHFFPEETMVGLTEVLKAKTLSNMQD